MYMLLAVDQGNVEEEGRKGSAWKRGGGGRWKEQGGEMAQTMYAHMNK
jgi:hypothetical protein